MDDTHPLAGLLLVLLERFPGCTGELDVVAGDSDCTSYLDVEYNNRLITVEWHRRRGWGVSHQPGFWADDAPEHTCKTERAVLTRMKSIFGTAAAVEPVPAPPEESAPAPAVEVPPKDPNADPAT